MSDGRVIIETDLDNSGIESGLGKLGSLVKAGIAAVGITKLTSELVQVGTAAVQVGANFEAGMSNVAAISGATGKDLESLTTKAKEMGAKTKFSATEASEAFSYMAMAGWKTSDMLTGIDGIMNLAAASGEDLASVSDIVTDAITAFGLSASDSGHFADVLAAASSNANTNVGMLGESFKYIAPVAGAMGYSVEDVTAALGLMANSSIKGSMAGTSLKTALSNMVAPTDAMAGVMEEYGISLTNADGSMKSLGEVMDILRNSLGGLDESTQTAAASTLFGKEAMAGMLAIVNASPADYEKLTSAIQNADGTAQKMSDTMQDNLQGSITILQSSLEGLGIQFYESIDDKLKSAVDAGIKSVERLSKAFEAGGLQGALKEAGKMFGEFLDKAEESNSILGAVIRPIKNLAKAGKDLGKAILPPITSAFKTLSKNLDIVVPALAAGAAAIKGYSIAKSVTKTISGLKDAYLLAAAGLDAYITANGLETVVVGASTGAITLKQVAVGLLTGQLGLATAAHAAFNAVMTALGGPVGLAITAVTALAAGLGIYKLMAKDSVDATTGLSDKQEENIKKSQEAIVSIEKETEARRKNIAASTAEIDQAEDLFNQLDKLVDENGRVKEGYEERAQFIVNELNSALGTEITITDGVIQKYGELQGSIDEVIAKKKAEAMISAMQSDYTEALQTQAEKAAELGKTYDKLNETKSKAKDLEQQLAKEAEKTKTYYHNNGEEVKLTTDKYKELQKELKETEGKVKEQQAAFDEASAAMKDNETIISDYEMILEASMSGNVENINNAVATLQSGIDTTLEAGSSAASKQAAKASETFLSIMKAQESGVANLKQTTVDGAAEAMAMTVSTIAGSSESIKQLLDSAGSDGAAKMIAGMVRADIGGNLSAEGKNGMQALLQTISGMDGESKEAMRNVIEPMLTELESAASELEGEAKTDADALLTALKEALGIHSPSAEVAAIFEQVWPGAEQGLNEGKDGPLESAGSFITEFLGTFTEGGLFEGMQSIGSNIMALFGAGVSSQSENSKATGLRNATAAQEGAASIDPTGTGTMFGSFLNAGISGMQGLLMKTGKTVADSARNGAGSVNPTKEGNSFGAILSSAIASTSGKLQSTGKSVAESAKSGAGSVDTTKTGSTFGNTFASAVSNTKAIAQSSAAAIASAANGARGLASVSGQSAGYNFGAGFGGGIRSAIGSAVSAAASLASRALSSIKSTLGIHSPSKETYKLGDFTGAGFIEGLEDQIPEVQKISNRIAEAAMNGMDVKGSVMQMKAAIQAENAKLGTVISQKAIYKMEQENQHLIIEALSNKMDEFMDQMKDIQILINTNAKLYLDKKEAGYALAPAVNRKLGEFQELNGRGTRK